MGLFNRAHNSVILHCISYMSASYEGLKRPVSHLQPGEHPVAAISTCGTFWLDALHKNLDHKMAIQIITFLETCLFSLNKLLNARSFCPMRKKPLFFTQLLFKKEIMCIFVLHNQGLSMAFMGPFLKFVHFGLWAAFLALSHVGSWLATAKR